MSRWLLFVPQFPQAVNYGSSGLIFLINMLINIAAGWALWHTNLIVFPLCKILPRYYQAHLRKSRSLWWTPLHHFPSFSTQYCLNMGTFYMFKQYWVTAQFLRWRSVGPLTSITLHSPLSWLGMQCPPCPKPAPTLSLSWQAHLA